MTKGLESLNYIKKRMQEANITFRDTPFNVIEEELQRLKEIDNAKPSEALEVLNNTISPLLEPILAEYEDDLSDKITANYFALKQTLLKAQEQEKVFEIIKEKNVMIYALKVSKTVDDYNDLVSTDEQLTQEEFYTLKRWVE